MEQLIRFSQSTSIILQQKTYILLAHHNTHRFQYQNRLSGRLMKKLVSRGIHIITMMKTNAVAYYPAIQQTGKHGRPKKYGDKIKLFDLFKTDIEFIKAPIPGNNKLIIEYYVIKLLWRPLGDFVQFILVKHPTHGNSISMSTDITIDPLDIVFGYSLKFKIEILFKQAIIH